MLTVMIYTLLTSRPSLTLCGSLAYYVPLPVVHHAGQHVDLRHRREPEVVGHLGLVL